MKYNFSNAVDNVLSRIFHGNLSSISPRVFIVMVSMPDLYDLNPHIKSHTCLDM